MYKRRQCSTFSACHVHMTQGPAQVALILRTGLFWHTQSLCNPCRCSFQLWPEQEILHCHGRGCTQGTRNVTDV